LVDEFGFGPCRGASHRAPGDEGAAVDHIGVACFWGSSPLQDYDLSGHSAQFNASAAAQPLAVSLLDHGTRDSHPTVASCVL